MKPLWESLEGCAMLIHSASVSSPLNEGEKRKKEKHQKMKSFAQWQQFAGMWRQVARYLPGMAADKLSSETTEHQNMSLLKTGR